MKNLKKYTIQEILDGDSSSDDEEPQIKIQFPWFKKGYQNIYDDLAYDPKKTSKDHIYPKSSVTDQKFILGESSFSEDVNFPKRFLVITANSGATDNMIDLFVQEGITSLVRLQHSQGNREDLDSQFAIDSLAGIDTFSKTRDVSAPAQHDENLRRAKVLDEKGQIVLAPINALLTSGTSKSLLDKYFQHKNQAGTPSAGFDTVIVDDASLIEESDII